MFYILVPVNRTLLVRNSTESLSDCRCFSNKPKVILDHRSVALFTMCVVTRRSTYQSDQYISIICSAVYKFILENTQ